MQDTTRLVKRSQLKRSQYKILGKPPQASCDVSHDAHLRDYDEEIFDDGDFYHQVWDHVIHYGSYDVILLTVASGIYKQQNELDW